MVRRKKLNTATQLASTSGSHPSPGAQPGNASALATLRSIGDAVLSSDLAENVTYLNPIAEQLTGWSSEDAVGQPAEEVLCIIDSTSRERIPSPLAAAVRQDDAVVIGRNCVLIRRDGFEIAIEDTTAPIRNLRGQITGAVIVFHDVSLSRAMSDQMSHRAQHDFLTDLPNRMLLADRLGCAIAAAHRDRTAFAVLFFDVDHFKQINDSVGHAVGDQLLQSIGRRLVSCVRETDTVSRLGGDEFVILLSDVTLAEHAASTARKILAEISRPHRIDHQDIHVTASIGIAVYPRDGSDAETLLKNADIALFRAKAEERNNHQLFSRDMAARPVKWTMDLPGAARPHPS